MNDGRVVTEPSTTEHELRLTLVEEGKRRESRITSAASRATGGQEGAAEALEELRAETHALKGAAAVVGQHRLFELGKALEDLVVDAIASGGSLSQRRAEAIGSAARAFVEGAEAAAQGAAEPDSIRASMEDLAA